MHISSHFKDRVNFYVTRLLDRENTKAGSFVDSFFTRFYQLNSSLLVCLKLVLYTTIESHRFLL